MIQCSEKVAKAMKKVSSNSCPFVLLFFQNLSFLAEIIIVKCPIARRNNVTRVRIEPGLCDQGRGKNDAFTVVAAMPILANDKHMF